MMDLSDGLASDIRHILHASDVGVQLELTAIPVAEGATLHDALTGGEDYKLLLTADQAMSEQLMRDFEATFHRPLYPIGHITAAKELVWLEKGVPTTQDLVGFRHF